jgi:hypothetical protein
MCRPAAIDIASMGWTAAKRRCVRFADISSYKILPVDSEDPNLKSHKCSEYEEKENELAQRSILENMHFSSLPEASKSATDVCVPFNQDPLISNDFSVAEKEDSNEQFELTKFDDGPGPAVLATYALVSKIVKDRKISRLQMMEILHSKSEIRSCNCLLLEAPPKGSTNISDLPADPRIKCIMAARSCAIAQAAGAWWRAAVCRGVRSRLTALRNRIRSHGKAVLPPSALVMGEGFIPALDFLSEAVQEVTECCSEEWATVEKP